MAYQGRKVFVAGTVLTASDMNSTVDQTVMVFADVTARNAAIPTPTEGMVVYLKDSNTLVMYNASSWITTVGTIAIADVTGLQTALDAKLDLAAAISTKTGAYTLVVADTNDLVLANGTFTITVPATTFATGTRVDIVNIGTGTITLAGSGLTISSKEAKLTITKQFAGATLFFTSSTTALLIGDLG
jgi:hypothetical protein